MAVLGVAIMGSETLTFPVAPTTLSYTASTGSPTPPDQAVTFSKNSLTSRPWTSSGNVAWITTSPSSGTIAREQDQIAVQVDATGLAVGTYSGKRSHQHSRQERKNPSNNGPGHPRGIGGSHENHSEHSPESDKP